VETAVGVRFGFTVGRRQARRAVQRVMVKRVMREAARSALGTVGELAADRNVDVVLRLRSPLPDPSKMGLADVKRALRAEADSLIEQLVRHLRAPAR
jgi:ribonuclease P protein component